METTMTLYKRLMMIRHHLSSLIFLTFFTPTTSSGPFFRFALQFPNPIHEWFCPDFH